MHSALYFHTKAGAVFNPESLVGLHAVRVDRVDLPNGEWVGKVVATSAQARKALEADPEITVLPPLHRPIQSHHAAAFAHVNAQEGEVAYDIAERLRDHHSMPWFDPEEWFL